MRHVRSWTGPILIKTPTGERVTRTDALLEHRTQTEDNTDGWSGIAALTADHNIETPIEVTVENRHQKAPAVIREIKTHPNTGVPIAMIWGTTNHPPF